MGFRLYDPEIGRFLAIDPLLDVQPSQTPYHYCFNNPTSFTDPTGLYPEKEKGDKVQEVVSYYWVLEEAFHSLMNNKISYEENWQMARRQWRGLFYLISDRNYNDRMYGNGGGGGGGGSSSGRTGTNESGNGVYIASMQLSKPKDWSVGEIAKVCEPADKLLNTLYSILQSFGVDKEVGYLLVRDNENESLSAEFFLGNTSDEWLHINRPPDGFTLSDNQIVIGFTHTHSVDLELDGPYDKTAIGSLSLGLHEWTNVTPNTISTKLWSMMYFGLLYNWDGNNFSKEMAISYKYYAPRDIGKLSNDLNIINDFYDTRGYSFFKSIEILYKKK